MFDWGIFGIGAPEIIVVVSLIFIIFGAKKLLEIGARSKSKQKPHSSYKMKKVKGHEIFLSYATSDRSTAKAISKALSSLGWTVWWDRQIPPGRSFDQVIEQAIDSARCMIVLWSQSSVMSDWVKTEASEGAKRQILVPAIIEDVKIPLEFRRIQAADLIGWKSSTSHSGFQNMVASIEALLGKTSKV